MNVNQLAVHAVYNNKFRIHVCSV